MSDMSNTVREALDVAVEAIGGAPREGQIEMAEAVANALTDRHHLMVQAGTGTGKSLAYLIPGIVHGRKLLVATATLALQRQLVDRDLPAVVPALEKLLGREISYAIYKGVGNYICLQKMNSEDVDPDAELVMEISSLEKDAKRLIAWAKTPGVSGDRDDAPEVDRRVWAANSVSGRECVGADVCAFGSQCFAANAKGKAQSADVVVTNHTLLAIEIMDLHPILPERDCIILDEAHEFMDRATQAVTDELTSARVLRAAAMARKFMPGKLADAFHKAANNFHESMVDYGESVRNESGSQGRLEQIPQSLESPIRKVREAAQAIVQSLTADENMLKQTPVIATSATLTVGNSFNSLAKSIGFIVGEDLNAELSEGELDPGNVQMLDVGSPFDFANQGVLYMPKHLPEPGRDGPSIEVLTELGELIDAAGGRTLALFSSWRGVEAADAHLRKVLAELPIKIITQKRGDAVGPLVARFAKDETSVLLGTMSLWQGVDVPGNSCILVAIDRIPFPRPDEPVMSARASQADAAGGSGFMQVSLPRAALLLAQGT
ncbi:MAG: ATP-dependent DNA helicase, partial [Actinobacteria bacterium]|nr:ATP-dependent DNA helicase [Actinomycetota bacterium]